jgi:hypothetical protein
MAWDSGGHGREMSQTIGGGGDAQREGGEEEEAEECFASIGISVFVRRVK